MIAKSINIQISTEWDTTQLAKLVQLANRFESKIYLKRDMKTINAKSIMGVMSLGVNTGDAVTICVDGEDEAEAMQVISDYLSGNGE